MNKERLMELAGVNEMGSFFKDPEVDFGKVEQVVRDAVKALSATTGDPKKAEDLIKQRIMSMNFSTPQGGQEDRYAKKGSLDPFI